VDRPEHLPFLLPWPRLALLIRRILSSQWDEATWPFAKHELIKALKLRGGAGSSGLVELEERARLLRAAVVFALVPPDEPELRLLHRCLDSWSGVGYVVAGMARHEYDLELRRYNGRGWQAMFFPAGFEHSFTSHAGSGWAPSPWQAVQHAARDALTKLETGEPAPQDWTKTDESPR
jgi:hypothetical protein